MQPCYLLQWVAHQTSQAQPRSAPFFLPPRSSKALRPSEANAEPANFRPTSRPHTSEHARIRFEERREQRESRQRRSLRAAENCLQSFVESGIRHSRGRHDARAVEGRKNTRT